jgi:hypothetical protein
MATLYKIFPSEAVARQAVAALRTAGVPARDIRLLTGCRLHDIRREPVGSFAGTTAPSARVGSYGNALRLRCQAKGGFAGDPDAQRQGSFADADLDLILTGDGRWHAAGDREVERLLHEAAVAGDAAAQLVGDLHRGRAVVLAEVAEIGAGDAWSRLEEVARAA